MMSEIWHPLRWINHITTSLQLKNARCLAIAQHMGLGDVIACLPMAGILKASFPHLKICFIGNTYVQPLIDCCEHIDQLLDAEEVLADPGLLKEVGVDIFINPYPNPELAVAAYRAAVPIRVGNLRRTKIIRYCNRFVMYSRRTAGRHEIELNLENLAGLGLSAHYPRTEIPGYFGLTRVPELESTFKNKLDPQKVNIVMHPKSSKNGREWPADHYLGLARLLPSDRFRIFVTGIVREGDDLRQEIPEIFELPNVVDLCGQMSLQQSLALINKVDGLIASGTGPLHVAAAMGKHALGIFPPREKIGPGHWEPIGLKGEFLCISEPCYPGDDRCPENFNGGPCACTAAITPEMVAERVLKWVC